jgi:hypothetical protein
MNWRLFALLAPIGPIMGTLTVVGMIPQGTDRFIWAVVMMGSAWLVGTRASDKPLLNGAATGFWNGATSTAIQAFCRETLFANNPSIREHFADRPNPVDLAYHLFLLIPFIAIVGGGLTGLLSMLVVHVRTPKARDGQANP